MCANITLTFWNVYFFYWGHEHQPDYCGVLRISDLDTLFFMDLSAFCSEHRCLCLTSLPAPKDHLAYKSEVSSCHMQPWLFSLICLINSAWQTPAALWSPASYITAEIVFPLADSLISSPVNLHSHCRWKQPRSNGNWHKNNFIEWHKFPTNSDKQSYQKCSYIT